MVKYTPTHPHYMYHTLNCVTETILGFMFCISRVLHWQPNAGTTVNSQILTEVSQCAESINGIKGGRWKATLNFYRPMLKGLNFTCTSLYL